MKIGTPKEIFAGEDRVAMTPASAKDLQKLGYDCVIETGAGKAARRASKWRSKASRWRLIPTAWPQR